MIPRKLILPRFLLWLGVGLGAAILQAGPALRVVKGESATLNLLKNADFEQQESDKFASWTPAPQGMRVASQEGRGGSAALACEATDNQGWFGANQTLELNQSQPTPIIVRGWSKAEAVQGGSDSGYSLYVDLVYRDGTPLWGQTANFRSGTHDWEAKELVILPDQPVRRLTLNCIFRGHRGKVWFDDLFVGQVQAPAGSLLFQGAPVIPDRGAEPSTRPVTEVATKDGLSLQSAGSQIRRLTLQGRELGTKTGAGFLARDVAANSDVFGFTDGACPELKLTLTASVTEKPDHLVVDGRVTDTSGADRAILLAFALPVEGVDWRWGDDIRRERAVTGTAEYANLTGVEGGSTGSQSLYPLGCVYDDRSGLALALDMGKPAQCRILYHAGLQQLLIAYDFGLVKETERFPSSAEFRFVIYGFEPRWGFRAAFQKLTRIFPDYFVVRSRDQGIWMPFTDISTVQGWEDFGFRYHEGNNNVAFDDQHDILSFRYTEPMTWWMSMAPQLPRDEATALKVRDELMRTGTGSQRQMAEVSRTTAMLDAEGHPALLFRNEPWANGAVWSLNPNPSLPAQPNAATAHWNETVRERLYGQSAKGNLDGEYLDSLEGYVTANLNFNREHFKHTTVPLTFASDTRQPALAKGLAVYEFTRWISDDLHRMGKLCFANGVPYRFGFLCPWLDVMGTETDWLQGGEYRPSSHAQMAYWRTLSGGKPYVLLLNTDYERFGPQWVERYFRRSLFYGMLPSMFSHNASENPYWGNPRWYNRDRDLFKRYLPLIKRVAEAGWNPVTQAVCEPPQLLVERFGPTAAGTYFYTVFNDSPAEVEGRLRETGPFVQPRPRCIARELLSGQEATQVQDGWNLKVGPDAVAVIEVQTVQPNSATHPSP